MLTRLLSDKDIGRRFILQQKKLYSVNSNEWYIYNNIMCHRYSRNFTNTNNIPISIASDTIIGLNYDHDIKTLKMDILALHSRINQLTNIVDKNTLTLDSKINNLTNTVDNNHDEVADKLFIFASDVRQLLDDISNKK